MLGPYAAPLCAGFPRALEIMENLGFTIKSFMYGKIMKFEKNLNNHGTIRML